MNAINNYKIKGSTGKPFLLDVHTPALPGTYPVVIFCHGFKGFKDFGAFNLVAEKMAAAGFIFVKFNFSLNGTTIDKPTEFEDLEAFSNNNYSIELNDLGIVLDWLFEQSNENEVIADLNQINIIGHSRGGSIVLLKSAEDYRIHKVCTWAAVNDLGYKWNDEVKAQWKQNEVLDVLNGRTKQIMPIKYQLCENYFNNLNRLHIPTLAKNITQPTIIIHGTNDEVVTIAQAEKLNEWIPNSELMKLVDANHTFGSKHPWEEKKLPEDLERVCNASINFFKN